MHARNSNCKYASSLLILRSISLNNYWWVAAGHDMKHKWWDTWSLANWIREFFAPCMLYVPKILFFYNLFKIHDSNSQVDVKWTESDAKFTEFEWRIFSWDNHKMQVLTDCDWLSWSFDEQSKCYKNVCFRTERMLLQLSRENTCAKFRINITEIILYMRLLDGFAFGLRWRHELYGKFIEIQRCCKWPDATLKGYRLLLVTAEECHKQAKQQRYQYKLFSFHIHVVCQYFFGSTAWGQAVFRRRGKCNAWRSCMCFNLCGLSAWTRGPTGQWPMHCIRAAL